MMKLFKFIILFITLNLSRQTRLTGRDGYKYKRRFRKEHPFLYKNWKRYGNSNEAQRLLVFQEEKGQPIVLKTILLLEFPPIEMVAIFKEILEVIYDSLSRDSYEDVPLLLGMSLANGKLDHLISDINSSSLSYAEFYTLLDEVQEGTRLKKIYFTSELYSFLEDYPKFIDEEQERLEQYSIAIRQGITFGDLSDLIESFGQKYKDLIHLPFWATSAGRLLFGIEKTQTINILPGKYLIDVLSDPIVQVWISSAYYKKESMTMVVIMFLFPEKAERIYENFKVSDNFKWVFTENLTDWRKEYAAMISWDEIRWTDIIFDNVLRLMRNSSQKENERFDLLVRSLIRNSNQQIFGQNLDRQNFLRRYEEKIFDYDEPAFFYMRLQQIGYPIAQIPNFVDDELENKILRYYQRVGIEGLMLDEMIKVLKIYPYSRYIVSGTLHIEMNNRSRGADANLLNSWVSGLITVASRFLGGNVDFAIPPNKRFNFFIIDEIFEYIVFKDDPTDFYPKLISKLRNETGTKNRAILTEVLSQLIFKRLDDEVPHLFSESIYSLLMAGWRDNEHIFDNWSDDFTLLPDDFNSIYKLCDPLSVLNPYFHAYLGKLNPPSNEYKPLWKYFENYDFTDNFFDDVENIVNRVNKSSRKKYIRRKQADL